jgi:hypothetical protein
MEMTAMAESSAAAAICARRLRALSRAFDGFDSMGWSVRVLEQERADRSPLLSTY